MKIDKKYWIYPVSAVVSGLALALPLQLAAHLAPLYAWAFGLLCAFGCLLVARLVCNIIDKTMDKSFIASEVWFTIALLMWLWMILNERASVNNFLGVGIIAPIVNGFGFRFIAGAREKEEKVAVPTKKDRIEELKATLRYRFCDDGKTPNLDAPLCRHEGKDLTCNEADEMGLGALAAEGIEYIKTIIG